MALSSLHLWLEANQRATAHRIFDAIIHAFESIQTRLCDRYDAVTLIRVMREGVEETDAFLVLFFGFVQRCLLGVEKGDVGEVLGYLDDVSALGEGEMERLGESVASFAEFLVENFFIPLKTWPDPPPYAFGSYGWHSVPQRSQYEECLYRDGHRCIISGKFDFHEYNHRVRDYDEPMDDDGVALPDDEEWEDQVEKLCFAHVVPWWIGAETGGCGWKEKRKQTAYEILRMFNPEAIESIAKPDAIDQPCNGVTLHQFVVSRFYGFVIGFEPVEDGAPHTYKIDTHDPLGSCSDFPVTRTLCARDAIELPSPKLLGVHFALGKILYLSGVGRYIDSLVRDMQRLKGPQDVFAPWDGSMRLDVYVRFKLGDDSYLADTG